MSVEPGSELARVFLGVGSNIEREENIRGAIGALRAAFGELVISPVYESRAVGFDGDNFYNLVVAFDTDREPGEVARQVQEIERRFGRERHPQRFAPRTLDLDVLLYGNLILQEGGLDIPRKDIGRYAFVLRPLVDIAGDRRHPVTGESFAELWRRFNSSDQDLWQVDVDFTAVP